MQFKTLSLATLLAVASAESSQSVIYDVETQTQLSTTDVTITSCSEHACTATVETTSHTIVTTTVNGIETVYTTVCPLTEHTKAAVSTEAPAAPAAPVSSAAPAAPAAPASSAAAAAPVAPASSAAPAAVAPVASEAAEASSGSNVYVDVTVTPTVQATTGVEATVTSQSTFTSVYNSQNSSAVAAVSTYAGEGSSPKVMIGAVGLAGLAAVLL